MVYVPLGICATLYKGSIDRPWKKRYGNPWKQLISHRINYFQFIISRIPSAWNQRNFGVLFFEKSADAYLEIVFSNHRQQKRKRLTFHELRYTGANQRTVLGVVTLTPFHGLLTILPLLTQQIWRSFPFRLLLTLAL